MSRVRSMQLAWLFPGQGSQEVGMGRALAESSPAARAVFDHADAALGRPLSRLCFEGPEADLRRTENTQPALVATSLAVLAAVRERHPTLATPACAAGHSLGEYSALVAAGALELTDALRLVELRGRAMQEAVPEGEGAMAAMLGGDREAVIALCDDARGGDVLEPANFNAPGQVVISGHRTAVERALGLAGERKLKGILLNVSAPFHSSLMAPAAERMRAALADVPLAALAFPVIANVDAAPNQSVERVRELLVRQMAGAVQWERTVQAMAAAGVTHALELGPGKVLAGLAKRIDKRLRLLSLSDATGIGELEAFLAS